jgi:hypothetical protein
MEFKIGQKVKQDFLLGDVKDGPESTIIRHDSKAFLKWDTIRIEQIGYEAVFTLFFQNITVAQSRISCDLSEDVVTLTGVSGEAEVIISGS